MKSTLPGRERVSSAVMGKWSDTTSVSSVVGVLAFRWRDTIESVVLGPYVVRKEGVCGAFISK